MSLDASILNAVASFLLKQKQFDFAFFTGQTLGQYKRQDSFKEFTAFLQSNENWTDSDPIYLYNLALALFIGYKHVNPDLIRNSSYELLEIICNRNPNFGNSSQLTTEQLNELKVVLQAARNNYVTLSQLSTSNPFTSQHVNIQTQINQIRDAIASDDKNNAMTGLSQLLSAIESQERNSITSAQISTTNLQQQGESQSTEQVECPSELSRVRNLYRRILVKQNHVSIIKFHLENNTTPSQLFFDKFPVPFLAHDDKAIEDHNKIIHETQIKLMKSIITHLNLQVDSFEKELLDLKNSIKDRITNSAQTFESIRKATELELKKQFDDAHEKASRITSRPFVNKRLNQQQSSRETNYTGRLDFHPVNTSNRQQSETLGHRSSRSLTRQGRQSFVDNHHHNQSSLRHPNRNRYQQSLSRSRNVIRRMLTINQ